MPDSNQEIFGRESCPAPSRLPWGHCTCWIHSAGATLLPETTENARVDVHEFDLEVISSLGKSRYQIEDVACGNLQAESFVFEPEVG